MKALILTAALGAITVWFIITLSNKHDMGSNLLKALVLFTLAACVVLGGRMLLSADARGIGQLGGALRVVQI